MKKIAVPVTNENTIDGHFGHCEFYKIYSISDINEIVDTQILKSEQGCGCKSNIASVLANQGVSVMLAGGIGAGAINVLASWGIEVVRGCSGIADEVVKNFVDGKVADSGSSCKQHDQHNHNENGHQCNH
jgi:predicted Fe-Mo cluster-binding NifX family protein